MYPRKVLQEAHDARRGQEVYERDDEGEETWSVRDGGEKKARICIDGVKFIKSNILVRKRDTYWM